MADWRDCKLGDLLAIKHGYAFLGEHFANAGSHIVLTPGNLFDEGGFKHKGDKEKWYNGPIPDDYVLNEGDLIVAMTEQAEGLLGSSAIVPRSGLYLHNQRLGLVQLRDESKTDKRFVYYLFNSKPVRQQIRASASGVKIRHTAPSRIADVKVGVPPLPVQRRIAGILSAYDELMENSQRRIRILEAMARALYREWFVHFRFPGHEKLPRVASPLGEIPQGWEVRTVKDVATVTYGFPFQSKKFNTDGIGTPVIRIRDIPEGFSPTFTDEDAEPKYHVKNGHILVGMDGDFHMCIWSSGHAFQNQRVARFESNGEIGNLHLFLALEKPIQEFNQAIVGTTVAHLGDMHIKTIQIVWPPPKLRAKAREVLEPMSEQIIALQRQMQNLRRTRDLLLPRLLDSLEAQPTAAGVGQAELLLVGLLDFDHLMDDREKLARLRARRERTKQRAAGFQVGLSAASSKGAIARSATWRREWKVKRQWVVLPSGNVSSSLKPAQREAEPSAKMGDRRMGASDSGTLGWPTRRQPRLRRFIGSGRQRSGRTARGS